MKLFGYLINIAAVITLPHRIPTVSIFIALIFLIYYFVRLKIRATDETTQFFIEAMSLSGFAVSIFNIIRTYTDKFEIYHGISILALLYFLNYLLHSALKWKIMSGLLDL